MARMTIGGKPIATAAPKPPAGSVDDLARRLDKIMGELAEAVVLAEESGADAWHLVSESVFAAAGVFLRLCDRGEVPIGWEKCPCLPSEAGGAEAAVVAYILIGMRRRGRYE